MGVDDTAGRPLQWLVLFVSILCCHLKAVRADDMTFVANASDRPVGVYYSPSHMTVDEIDVVFGTRVSPNSMYLPGEVRMAIKRDHRIRYLRIPTKDVGKILDEGSIYVTVLVEPVNGQHDVGIIAQNFFIPNDRSFIVTPNYNIQFQRYAASVWVGENGINYR